MRAPSSRQFASQRGIALVLVLWLVALLGILAGSHAENVHTETVLAAHHVAQARARALAQAGAQLAILQLLAPGPAGAWPIDGTVGRFELDGHRIQVAIRDTTGLIDLNTADAGTLGALLAAVGLADEQRDALVDAILDWRDGDDLHRLHGAEDDDYIAAGYPWTARDGAFTTIEELAFVRGVTPAVFRSVAPFITVHSERTNVELEFAPPFVIGALTGQVVTATPAARTTRAGTPVGTGTFQIYVDASAGARMNASMEATVQIVESGDRPYAILDWTEPMRTPFPDTEEDLT